MTEVMVTSGGTEALTSAILAVVEPGDEVVVFQPVYDSYLPIIRQAGGIPRLLRLEPPEWRLNEEMLQGVFNHKTKAVLFNNPLNPAAVVYPREDSNCWRGTVRSSTPLRSATRSGSTWCSMAANISR